MDYAIGYQTDAFSQSSDIPIIAFRFDGKTLVIIGDDKDIKRWLPYFTKEDGLWFGVHRFEENPLLQVFGGGFGIIRHFPGEEGEERFLRAMTELNGKTIKTIEYPERRNG